MDHLIFHHMKKTINKGTTYCGLDSNQLISTSNIPDLSESKITNLTSDLSACEKTINKDTASGYASLDTNTKLKVSQFPKFGSTISYYVDCNYTLGSNDGSKLRPFTTITSALNAIGTDTGATRGTYGEPTSNTDIHLHDQFAIYVEHGIYNETITVPGFRFISLIAVGGLVSIGDSQSQYWDSSGSGIKDVYINVYKNPAVTVGYYRGTVIFTASLNVNDGQFTHETNMSGWLISGRILATFVSGSGFTDSEWLFNQVRVRDLNSTSTFITWIRHQLLHLGVVTLIVDL